MGARDAQTLLGIIICFAQVPESIAFAYMAHVKAPVALHAAWEVGLVCGMSVALVMLFMQ